MLFECFLAFFGPKNAKKHSKSTLWGTPRQVPKIAQKALRGALSGPGPKSTPVNGGGDRKTKKSCDLDDVFGGFDCFGGSGRHLAPLLVLQNTVPRGGRDGGCGGFGRDGFGHDGYPT